MNPNAERNGQLDPQSLVVQSVGVLIGSPFPIAGKLPGTFGRARMSEEAVIRRLLIDSCHSSVAAKEFFRSKLTDGDFLSLLVHIAKDSDDYGGDAPMEAAYWASQYPPTLLMPHEPELLEMLPIVNGYGGHVALALGKTRSVRGRMAIVEELGDGQRFDAWLFHEAIKEADRPG